MEKIEGETEHFFISTSKELLDLDIIHEFLSAQSYWAKDIKKELVNEMINHSPLCYGIYKKNPHINSGFQQVGFARVITDFVRFSWLADVFILSAYRGEGLGKWLLDIIVNHPNLKGTRFMLATEDAHHMTWEVNRTKSETLLFINSVLEGYKAGTSADWAIVEKSSNETRYRSRCCFTYFMHVLCALLQAFHDKAYFIVAIH